MKVQILVDNKASWIIPYAKELKDEIQQRWGDCRLIHLHQDVEEGDVLCLLSCEKLFKDLSLNQFNLVVHESALPKGRGWSPLTWQVLEGSDKIPVTLFEATENVDEGKIYAQKFIELDGTELNEELKHKQGVMTKHLIWDFLENYPNVESIKQVGEPTYYARRTPEDSELDITKSIEEQFNLLRVCDNERYPAYFVKNGVRYILKITKADED